MNNRPISSKVENDLGWNDLVRTIAGLCQTEQASIRALNIAPLLSPHQAMYEQKLIVEADFLLEQGRALPWNLFFNSDALLKRIEKGAVATLAEIVQLKDFLILLFTTRELLVANQRYSLCQRFMLVDDVSNLRNVLIKILDEEGQLKEDASLEYFQALTQFKKYRREITLTAEALLKKNDLKDCLQERLIIERDGYYLIPVQANKVHRVEGKVRGSSASGATVFIEPLELVEKNRQLDRARFAVEQEIIHILKNVSAHIAQHSLSIYQNTDRLIEFDLLLAKAQWAYLTDSKQIEFVDTNTRLHLFKARHPLLALKQQMVVSNDIEIRFPGILLISGPNGGGKTVVLKTLGLIVLMAQSGLLCPVGQDSVIPWFEEVLTDVCDDQNLERGLSTFAAHLLSLKKMIESLAQPRLLLIDEIASGTDPQLGAYLAEAILEFLLTQPVVAVVSTHFPSLKMMGFRNPMVTAAGMGYNEETLMPTYQLHLKTVSPSKTFALATRMGIPSHLIEKAQNMQSCHAVLADGLIEQIQKDAQNLSEKKMQTDALYQQLMIEQQQVLHEKEKWIGLVQKVERESQRELTSAIKKIRSLMTELNEDIKLRSQNTQKIEKSEIRQIESALRDLLVSPKNELSEQWQEAWSEDTETKIHVGAFVQLATLGDKITGIVLNLPVNGKILVQVGNTKMHVAVGDIRVLKKSMHKKTNEFFEKSPEKKTQEYYSSSDNTIDLRGLRTDEALTQAERFVDHAILQGEEAVFLLHGQGTGILQKQLRSYFLKHPAIQAVRLDLSNDRLTCLQLK